MGKKNNVNPNHYKTAGRERPGQDVVHEIHKQKYTQAQENETGSQFIPGKNAETEKETGQENESANSSSNT